MNIKNLSDVHSSSHDVSNLMLLIISAEEMQNMNYQFSFIIRKSRHRIKIVTFFFIETLLK